MKTVDQLTDEEVLQVNRNVVTILSRNAERVGTPASMTYEILTRMRWNEQRDIKAIKKSLTTQMVREYLGGVGTV